MFFLKALPTLDMIEGYVQTLKTGDSKQIASALLMMREASLLVRQIDAYFAAHHLSQLKFLILVVIDREPQKTALRQSEILERLDVSKPVLHRTVNALLKDGLLQQADDPNDRRAALLSLTARGSQRLLDVLPGYFEIISEFIESGG